MEPVLTALECNLLQSFTVEPLSTKYYSGTIVYKVLQWNLCQQSITVLENRTFLCSVLQWNYRVLVEPALQSTTVEPVLAEDYTPKPIFMIVQTKGQPETSEQLLQFMAQLYICNVWYTHMHVHDPLKILERFSVPWICLLQRILVKKIKHTSSWDCPPLEADLGWSFSSAPSILKVSFWANVMFAFSWRPKISGLSLIGRLLM